MDNLINRQINKILVLERIGAIEGLSSRACYYKCKCECGKYINVRKSVLAKSTIKSCGCIGKHYMTKTNEYTAWQNMKNRCLNKNNLQYNSYGGRGIKICKEWISSFDTFIKDMGMSNGLTLERIDVNGNYEPSNCKWATRHEQSINKQNSKFIIYEGAKVPLIKKAKDTNTKYSTLLARFNKYGDLKLDKRVFLNKLNGVFYNSYSEIALVLNEHRRNIQYRIESYGEYKNFIKV